jgi:hypothetical protein
MSDEYLPEPGQEHAEVDVKAPFTFKLLIVLTVLYLGWRLVQGIVWLVQRLT